MSVIPPLGSKGSKIKYLAAKVLLVKSKIQHFIGFFQRIKQMGLDLLLKITNKIKEVVQLAQSYMQMGLDKLTRLQQKAMKRLNEMKEKLQKKLQKLVAKITEIKNKIIDKLEEMIENAVKGISGFSLEVEITAPDPLTGSGGGFSAVPVPDIFDEATDLSEDLIKSGIAGGYPVTLIA